MKILWYFLIVISLRFRKFKTKTPIKSTPKLLTEIPFLVSDYKKLIFMPNLASKIKNAMRSGPAQNIMLKEFIPMPF